MVLPPGDEVPAHSEAASPSAGTGDARVDEAVSRLDDLAGLPVAEHPAVFEYVHERLTEALGDIGAHGQAGTGGGAREPGRPGG